MSTAWRWCSPGGGISGIDCRAFLPQVESGWREGAHACRKSPYPSPQTDLRFARASESVAYHRQPTSALLRFPQGERGLKPQASDLRVGSRLAGSAPLSPCGARRIACPLPVAVDDPTSPSEAKEKRLGERGRTCCQCSTPYRPALASSKRSPRKASGARLAPKLIRT